MNVATIRKLRNRKVIAAGLNVITLSKRRRTELSSICPTIKLPENIGQSRDKCWRQDKGRYLRRAGISDTDTILLMSWKQKIRAGTVSRFHLFFRIFYPLFRSIFISLHGYHIWVVSQSRKSSYKGNRNSFYSTENSDSYESLCVCKV